MQGLEGRMEERVRDGEYERGLAVVKSRLIIGSRQCGSKNQTALYTVDTSSRSSHDFHHVTFLILVCMHLYHSTYVQVTY